MTRPRKLADWQASHIRRAVSLREKLTNKHIAAKFGVTVGTVRNYAIGIHKDGRGKA